MISKNLHVKHFTPRIKHCFQHLSTCHIHAYHIAADVSTSPALAFRSMFADIQQNTCVDPENFLGVEGQASNQGGSDKVSPFQN